MTQLLIEWKPWEMRQQFELQTFQPEVDDEFKPQGSYVEGMVEANDRLLPKEDVVREKPVKAMDERKRLLYEGHMAAIYDKLLKEQKLLANATRIRDRHQLKVLRLREAHMRLDGMLAKQDGRTKGCEPFMPKEFVPRPKKNTLKEYIATLKGDELKEFEEQLRALRNETGLGVK